MDKNYSTTIKRPTWQPQKLLDRSQKVNARDVILSAVSVIAMARLGFYFILLFYLLWLPHLLNIKWTMPQVKALAFPMLIVIYFLLSTLWSDNPFGTLHSAIQFASTMVCVAVIARLVNANSFIVGIVIGTCMTLLQVIIVAGGLPQETGLLVGQEASLVGFMGSKNQVGAIAEVGVYCSLLSWFLFRNILMRLVFSLFPLALCLICLIYSRSTTSTVSLAATFGISYAIYIIGRLSERRRKPVFFSLIVFIAALAIIGSTFDWQKLGLEAVGKDATLTGRTLLWQEGMKYGLENPFFGVGYDAFWVPGNPAAEKLWAEFGVPGRMGFHFHNLFINEFVELGFFGLMIWLLMYLVTWGKASFYVLKNGNSIESTFYVGMMSMYIIRAITEAETKYPYGFATLFLFYVVMRAADRDSKPHDKLIGMIETAMGQGTPVKINTARN